MELRVSPEKPGFSSSDLASDPDDKGISEGEDEDDDRNHKHRKREAHSQSLEGDSHDQGLTRPYRKRNRPFENGYSYRDDDPQAGETWRNHNNSSDRGFPSRFEKRRSNQGSFPNAPLELHQRFRGNQSLPGEAGPIWGRGRVPIPWGIRDSRLGLVDVSSQVIQPAMYAGRGFPNVPNAHSAPWNAFGLVPGVPNGGLDPLHPLGIPGAHRPVITPPLNIGIPMQRCRDFEERGFCLRGDMCPMEHGINRIVVDDVQSLSRFNLSVALPGPQILGTSSGQGALPVNNKSFHANISKPGMTEYDFGPSGGVLGGSVAGASDVYDPDQPLWAKDDPQTSAAIRALNQSTADGTVSLLGVESVEVFNEESSFRNATAAGSLSTSVWGRVDSSKRNSEAKEKLDSVGTSSSCLERAVKSDKAQSTNAHVDMNNNNPLIKESSLNQHNDPARNIQKPSQKALRTLFVRGIPPKDNRKETLLSHFQKFGEVIDIYIPAHGERAFVQFLKREEAEAALKAPDAVMGNRFIKLWWANRDNITDDRISGSSSSVPITPRGVTTPTSDKKVNNTNASAAQPPVYDHPKPAVGNIPKAPPPQQKKLETLELLKEQLRKKQEMLDQKRNEFKLQLDKLEKQAVGSKDVTVTDLTTKRLKGETPPNHAKVETSKSSSPKDNIKTENTSAEHAVLDKSTSNTTLPVQEPLKPSFRPSALIGSPFAVNRFKLDNRPKTFRIVPPLPAGLANVAALKEHFSTYGELSLVELDEPQQDTNDTSVSSNVSARVSFTARHFAEKAFLHGKSWQSHKLKFMWLPSVNSGKEGGEPSNIPAASNTSSDANSQTGEKNASTIYQKTAALGSDEDEHLDIVM
ncbi:hypothetical protein CASFOL_033085 [Castilleja foliolosa]|uniref:Zinc finger CCCH domain-containing protein 41 n=1 Tax=Castilleja foliolosa TaxID=1961234 RepID=A0ABD3C3X4_9LAMI